MSFSPASYDKSAFQPPATASSPLTLTQLAEHALSVVHLQELTTPQADQVRVDTECARTPVRLPPPCVGPMSPFSCDVRLFVCVCL